jgi:hypothetical protein
MQNPSYKRIGLALCASIALHSMLFGGFNFALPSPVKSKTQVIEARLVLKPADKKTETVMPKAEEAAKQEPPVKKPVKKIKPVKPKPSPSTETSPPPEAAEPIDAIKPEDTLAAEITPEVIPEAIPEAVTAVAEPVIEPALAETPVEPLPEQDSDDASQKAAQAYPDDTGVEINENAYQHVETDFDVSTKIDGNAEGKANITYNLLNNGQYQLKWLTQPRGLASLVISDLLQTSEGTLTTTGLQPSVYVYNYGDKADKTYTASFDWQNKKVLLHTSKLDKTEDLPEGTQDLLSFMYQFMHVPPLQKMQINIATGRKLASYDYAFEGEEEINTTLGSVKTMHIVHTGSESEEKTELWLAVDYQYIPVKIRKIEKNGKVYELRANRIKTVLAE